LTLFINEKKELAIYVLVMPTNTTREKMIKVAELGTLVDWCTAFGFVGPSGFPRWTSGRSLAGGP